ncbi:MAG: amino acid permease, partial [ANME-2 cluster archaeon]|nr:amino acid permease [ANME-2 cluster archaeon]
MGQVIKLKRELGLFEVTMAGVGVILGAGIYALIGQAAGLAGNSVWISFCLAALIALFTGLSYAELSSMYPKASAEYEYTANAFGKHL